MEFSVYRKVMTMCIKDNYNSILESNNWQDISDFMDANCEDCPKLHGGCDYKGWLDDRLVELEGQSED